MTELAKADTTPAAAPSKSLPVRLVGVLFSPRATYASVAARPRWFGALAFVVLFSIGALVSFASTEVGRTAMLDQQVRQRESFTGRSMTDAEYERLQRIAPYTRYFAAGGQLVVLPLAAAILAGVALAIFNALLGADATFRQVFAIVAHSGVVIVLAQVFGLPLAYARESLTGATNLAVFFPFLDDTSFAARFLSGVDLFYVWWFISLAIGLGVLYKRRTAPIAATILSIYVLIALVIGAIKSTV